MAVTPRESWLCWCRGKFESKNRPGIITRVEIDVVEVAFAAGNPHPGGAHVEVLHPSGPATSLGLTKTTYFRVDGVVPVPLSDVIKRIGHCPPNVWSQILDLVTQARRRSP